MDEEAVVSPNGLRFAKPVRLIEHQRIFHLPDYPYDSQEKKGNDCVFQSDKHIVA